MKTKNLKHLIRELEKDPDLMSEFKADPLDYLKNEVKEDHPLMNKFVFLTIVVIVTGILAACLWAALKIIFHGAVPGEVDVPDFIVGIIGTCLGAIVGLLAPSPINQGES